jgi:hypothetical protein
MISRYLDVLFYSRSRDEVINAVRARLQAADDLDPPDAQVRRVRRFLRFDVETGAGRWALPVQTASRVHPTSPQHTLKMIRFTRADIPAIRDHLDEIEVGGVIILKALAWAAPEDGGPIQHIFENDRTALIDIYRQFWPESVDLGDGETRDQSYPDGAFRFVEFAGDSRLRAAKANAQGL